MTYIIYKDGIEENRIVADEEFCKQYYSGDGYSYKEEPAPEPGPIPPPEPDKTTLLASIAFVTLAELGSIDDVTAGEHAEAFAEWAFPVFYKTGSIRRFGGGLYRCVQEHTSQEDWTPDTAVSLWVRISDPSEEWPEWSQPVGAHDAYNAGDKVSHQDKHWISEADGNVWEPGVYGWSEAK